MSEQAEDPGRTEPAGTKLSSFSSSLGPQRFANTDAAEPPGTDSAPTAEQPPPSEPAGPSAMAQMVDRLSDVSSQLDSLWSERPEVVIGAAFVGGLLIATIIKRLAR